MSIDYSESKYYENRELSWLKFNERVLSEAENKDTPLFERLKFLGITASNLDEFIIVRIASLKDMESAGIKKPDIAGLDPAKQLSLLADATHALVDRQYNLYKNELVPELLNKGLRIVAHHEDLTEAEAGFVDEYFEDEIYPVLTPMAVDSSRPFPLIRNRSLNLGALVTKKNGDGDLEFATVQVPSVLGRIIELPHEPGDTVPVILLEEVIERNISKLFLNYDIVSVHPFRIMRSADFSIDEDETEDLLKEVERSVRMRQWGEAIRLEVERGMDERLFVIIKEELLLRDKGVFKIDGPLDLTFLMRLYAMEGFDDLKEHSYPKPQINPDLPPGTDLFEAIRNRNILLFHPYESFDPVVSFIRQASKDPDVLAIKETLYRVSGHSPIIAALAEAAENGKQVTVLVELKARFDEENNIIWAKRLEQAGAHVIYGLVGLKTHCKITLVVRREEDGIRRYVHLATGNYNDATAKLYTDIGYFTAMDAMGEDATAVFNMLSGYSEPLSWNKLSLAPLWLKDRFLNLIQREKEHAEAGLRGHIIAKMNSLCDKDVILALYEAARAGVKIELIVRGICSLKTGLPETGDRIVVRSIVGNYLEHARIFYFENAGKEEYYCSSADWMPRNLERRVEILFPIQDRDLCEKLRHILDLQLRDNVKAQELQKNGTYVRVSELPVYRDEEEKINSQLIFGQEAVKRAESLAEAENSRVFIPRGAEE
ncbi:MAG: RNA degradosome polyphosphate kinase [Lachnospiraceae bacterium]|nr:RNA degradosome polyphosphate kinase [Lachnospiraceae bacterium]